jgi:hypothetical protein
MGGIEGGERGSSVSAEAMAASIAWPAMALFFLDQSAIFEGNELFTVQIIVHSITFVGFVQR